MTPHLAPTLKPLTRHCEKRSEEATQKVDFEEQHQTPGKLPGLPRYARNDTSASLAMTLHLAAPLKPHTRHCEKQSDEATQKATSNPKPSS
jgi:hypothetical protein